MNNSGSSNRIFSELKDYFHIGKSNRYPIINNQYYGKSDGKITNIIHQTLNIKHLFLLFILLLTFYSSSKAQNQDVIIIDSYKPTISDAFKINESPKITDSVVEKLNLTYQISPKLYTTTFNVAPIKPAKMVGEPLVKFYKSYIKGGLGTRMTTLGEFYLTNLRATNQSFGIYYKHLASAGKIRDYAFPGFSDNDAGIYARKISKKKTLSGELEYKRNVVHYYGFNPDDFGNILNGYNKDSIKQRFANIGGKIYFKSTNLDSSDINYQLSLKYNNLSDSYEAMEDYINFKANLNKNVNVLGKSCKNQNLGVDAEVNFYNDKNDIDTISYNGAATLLHPRYSANYSIVKFDIGLNTWIKTIDGSGISAFPEVNASFNLFNNIFIIYGGCTNNLKRNNFIEIAAENPFINTTDSMQFTETKKYFGGFKGSISSNLYFNVNFSGLKVENMPLFFPDSLAMLRNKFVLIYDNAKLSNLHAELTYEKAGKYKAMLAANYYMYDMKTEEYAWYKPKMDLNLMLTYNLNDKIIIKSNIIGIGESKAPEQQGSDSLLTYKPELKGIIDFNLGVEYRYTKLISAFINFNNVGAVKYRRWYNYPSYRFNVIGGISFSF